MSVFARIISAGAAVALLAAPSLASAAGSPGPTAVSGPTPFPTCTAGTTPTSTVDNGSEAEPWIAVNPRDHRNIVTYYQQDRWNDGGAHSLVASVTHDGGRHWKQVAVPGIARCVGGDYDRASDAGVSFAPNGDLYEISLSFNAADPINGVLVSKSTDGGDTWSKPTTLIRDTEEAFFDDKELITADPTSAQRAYAVWDRSNEQGGQPVFFSRTTDGGRTWEKAHAIYDPTPGWTIANQIAVQPDGTLIDMFFSGPAGTAEEPDRPIGAAPRATPRVTPRAATPYQIQVIRSTDHGKTWSKPDTVAQPDPSEIVDPDGKKPLRTGDIVPDIAVDPHSGRLYVVWQDASAAQSGSAILLASSSDAGKSWTKPVRVSQTPDSAAQGNGQAFDAAVDVNASGTVGVTYYDFRRNTAAAGASTDYWIARCHGGSCTRTTSAWRERHVGGSFDATLSPDAGGYFLGDYLGLAHSGDTFWSSFAMTHPTPGNDQDDYVAAIR